MNDEAKDALYWKDHALAWDRYDHAAMLGTEEEIDEAQRVLDATTNQLYEFGDLPGRLEPQP